MRAMACRVQAGVSEAEAMQNKCDYAKIPKHIIRRVSSRITVMRDVDPEALLLEGRSDAVIKIKTGGEYTIQINSNIRKVRNPLLRRQVVHHTLIHELLHIENKDLITLSKAYGRRKKKRIHKKEFDEKVHARFNEIRAKSGMPPIKNMADADAAINKVLSDIKFG